MSIRPKPAPIIIKPNTTFNFRGRAWSTDLYRPLKHKRLKFIKTTLPLRRIRHNLKGINMSVHRTTRQYKAGGTRVVVKCIICGRFLPHKVHRYEPMLEPEISLNVSNYTIKGIMCLQCQTNRRKRNRLENY